MPRRLKRMISGRVPDYEDIEAIPPHFFGPSLNRQDGIPNGYTDDLNSEFPFYGDDNMSDFFQERLYDSPTTFQRLNPPLQNVFPNVTVTGSKASSQISLLQPGEGGETGSHLLRVTPKHQPSRPRSTSQGSEHSSYSDISNRSNLTQRSYLSHQSHHIEQSHDT